MRKTNVNVNVSIFIALIFTWNGCVHEHVLVSACACLYFGLDLSTFSSRRRWVVDCMCVRIDLNFMPRCACVHGHLSLLPIDSCDSIHYLSTKNICDYPMHGGQPRTQWFFTHRNSVHMCLCLCNSLPISMVTQSYLICKWHLICTNVIEFLCYHIFKFA